MAKVTFRLLSIGSPKVYGRGNKVINNTTVSILKISELLINWRATDKVNQE